MNKRVRQANNENLARYLLEHKNLRVWQNIRNWSKADAIIFVKGLFEVDTFKWKKRDEFDQTIKEL